MDDELFQLIAHLTELEHKNVELNSELLQDMINKGVQDINKLDQVADRLMDSMLGITGNGEAMYRKYLDYIETFNPQEAKERKDDLEYELGYKTHVLYAAAILCKKETENLLTVIGKPSFDRIFHNYISKVWSVKKKTASFLLFAHYASEKTVAQLMNMLKTITEETDYILSRIDEFEDLMHFPSETYHPLREDEWELIQFIAEHNINLLNSNPKQKKEILHDVFGI